MSCETLRAGDLPRTVEVLVDRVAQLGHLVLGQVAGRRLSGLIPNFLQELVGTSSGPDPGRCRVSPDSHAERLFRGQV